MVELIVQLEFRSCGHATVINDPVIFGAPEDVHEAVVRGERQTGYVRNRERRADDALKGECAVLSASR